MNLSPHHICTAISCTLSSRLQLPKSKRETSELFVSKIGSNLPVESNAKIGNWFLRPSQQPQATVLWIYAWKWKVLSQKFCQATVNFTLDIQFLPSLSSTYWKLSCSGLTINLCQVQGIISAKQHGTLASLETKSVRQAWLCEQARSMQQDFDPQSSKQERIEETPVSRLQCLDLEETTTKSTSTY